MMLGVLYAVLMLLVLSLWARTNSAYREPLDIWRFLLIELAVVGLLMTTHQTWPAYWAAFAGLSLIAWAHITVFLSTHREIPRMFAFAAYGCVSLFYWLFAWISYPSYVQRTGPLVIVLIGIVFCYVPLGRRAWEKRQSRQ